MTAAPTPKDITFEYQDGHKATVSLDVVNLQSGTDTERPCCTCRKTLTAVVRGRRWPENSTRESLNGLIVEASGRYSDSSEITVPPSTLSVS